MTDASEGLKERRKTIAYSQLFLTNSVEQDSIPFANASTYIAADTNPPSIVVTAFPRGAGNKYLILDGNHRAIACASLNRQVRIFEVRSQRDIDQLLQIEAKGGVGQFPHRKFLLGAMSLNELRKLAVEAARILGFCTVQEKVVSFK